MSVRYVGEYSRVVKLKAYLSLYLVETSVAMMSKNILPWRSRNVTKAQFKRYARVLDSVLFTTSPCLKYDLSTFYKLDCIAVLMLVVTRAQSRRVNVGRVVRPWNVNERSGGVLLVVDRTYCKLDKNFRVSSFDSSKF